jgi:hypothetical protein
MPSVYDIYERKNYFNRFLLENSVNFKVEVRETNLRVQARADLSSKAKDAVFRYRYQIEEYLRQHPAFRESMTPVQIFASAPEIIRYTDLSSRVTEAPPMACMSGAMADFVGKDLAPDSQDLVVSSGGDSYVRSTCPMEVQLHAKGSPNHMKLAIDLPKYANPFGISTYAPGKGIHSVTVLSRSACWASAFARDLGSRLARGEDSSETLKRAENYSDVGGVVLICGARVILGGDLTLKSVNGKEPKSQGDDWN